MPEDRTATYEIALTHFIVSSDVGRSCRFYADVLGGRVIRSGEPSYVALANSWIIINVGGGPTDDKPSVILETPPDPDRASSFLNIRVSDIHAVHAEWSARGAAFLTPPKQHQSEIRCYLRDPDGYLIEVGQTTLPGGWDQFLVQPCRALSGPGNPGSGSLCTKVVATQGARTGPVTHFALRIEPNWSDIEKGRR
jgi:catechol 2,3-dioxygenase-like lactoylglutathione lyase family enzyme